MIWGKKKILEKKVGNKEGRTEETREEKGGKTGK